MNLVTGKKILWLTSWYPNRMDEFDGDFIQRHAKAVALFCRVHVIFVVKATNKLSVTEKEERTESNLTEQIIYYSSPKTGISLLDRFLSQRKYNQCCRKAITAYINTNGNPDYVHVHVAMKAGLAALWIKKKWNIPFIVTEHWTGYYRQSVPSVFNYNWLFRKLNKKILKEAACFLPVSKDLGETVKQNFINIPYHVVPNVVNTELFYYNPVKPEKFRFIHISYMNYQKNPEGIIKASSLLHKSGYDFEVLMLGNKDKRLMQFAKQNNLPADVLFFAETVPYTDVAKQMQNSSALLLFSRFENLPCVILEALCCGLPVISSRVGGIAEVLNESNGIMVESENTEELATAMQQLMDSYSLYNRLVIAADAVSKFNYNKVGMQYVELYKNSGQRLLL